MSEQGRKTGTIRALRWIVPLLLLCACAADSRAGAAPITVRESTPLATSAEQLKRLCAHQPIRPDRVLDVFCTQKAEVTSLVELRAALGLDSNENDIYRGFVLVGHSTALTLHTVSQINPRIIFILPQDKGVEMAMLAFARGEQTAEIVVQSRLDAGLQFYLVTYKQDCNDAPGGCAPGDLLTDAVESGWKDVNVYAEEDLENTPRDCRTCHQPDGPQGTKFLRMQEFKAPWNHWFWRQSVGGRAVLDDYFAAKGNEEFAGVPGDKIINSQPGLLNYAFFIANTPEQPNAYDSVQILKEVIDSAAALGGNQPTDNSVPGESPTWNAIYERSKRGEAISVPYHDVKVTDQAKLASMTQAYTDYREGRLAREDLPDIRDVFPDDELLRAQMGQITEPGLDGNGVLLQACSQCHNDRLDQTLSRARFDVDLKNVSRGERALAISRIQLPRDNPAAMPPVSARGLSDEGRQRLIELLKK